MVNKGDSPKLSDVIEPPLVVRVRLVRPQIVRPLLEKDIAPTYYYAFPAWDSIGVLTGTILVHIKIVIGVLFEPILVDGVEGGRLGWSPRLIATRPKTVT